MYNCTPSLHDQRVSTIASYLKNKEGKLSFVMIDIIIFDVYDGCI